MRTLIIALAVLAAAAGGGAWYWYSHSKPPIAYRTEPIKHGELLATISATGTIEPEESIDVGAQVGGMIDSFGTDADKKPVDYDSRVKKGMVLAHIDERLYKADLDLAQAQLAQAKATLLHNQADLKRLQALLDQARSEWDRAQKIGPSDALSQNDFDTYKANFETADANVKVGVAAVAQAKAGLDQAQSTYDRADANVKYCTITSPVDGVIIDRRVNIGQTVVSSLSAPSLFLIAKDLTKMQIWVSVNEADIGQIHPDQKVDFTCDAYPGEVFHGAVGKIRLNAQMTQNVVTYTVEVTTDNSSGRLLPYLTANVQFEVQKHPNVLLVPNAALRWYPTEVEEVVPDARTTFKAPTFTPHDEPSPERKPRAPVKPQRKHERHGMIWMTDGQFVRPIDVKVGPTDGINTEVQADGLKEGTPIVLGEIVDQGNGDDATRNPFLPRMNRRR